jgi:hypothetical protein
MYKPARRRGEPAITEVFFILGALMVLVGLIYSMKKSWPSFDPLALAMLIGIGFLLVVVCERLRILVLEVARIGEHLERMASPPEHRAESGETPAKG